MMDARQENVFMYIIKQIPGAAIAVVLMLTIFSGCAKSAENKSPNEITPRFTSFRDIPGVTEDEKAAIGELRKKYASFVYGVPQSTEAFRNENGEVRGFSALLCGYLTELFDIRFEPAFTEGETDFTGEMKPAEERGKSLFMTEEPVARRYLVVVRIEGSRTIAEIEGERMPRYAFLKNSAAIEEAASVLTPGSYEAVTIESDEFYQILKNGEADGLVVANIEQGAFDAYEDLVIQPFYPLVFLPVSLAAEKPELASIISVMDKALKNGEMNYLIDLYDRGYNEYKKNNFLKLLTGEEREYIKNNPTVVIAAVNWFYPVCFYNKYENRWEGIGFDAFDEVAKITGINFKLGVDPDMSWAEIYEKMESGEIPTYFALIYTADRAERYVWSEHKYITENYALISKQSFPDISINKIPYAKIGLMKDMGYTVMFNKWFPDAVNTTMYETQNDAFLALDKGEIDLLMTGTNTLLSITNYYEYSGYKANFIFDTKIEYSSAFSKSEPVLFSVIEKALKFADVQKITKQWESRTYDYQRKMLKAQRPWLIGAVGMSLVVLALILILFYRNHGEGKRLGKLVEEQTSELMAASLEARIASEEARKASLEAKNASEAKSRFIANMSHEMRTPMNVIVGLTDLMLEEGGIPGNIKGTLKKINTAGDTLMGLINDVLDISKIEAGKLELMPVEYDVASNVNDVIALNMIRTEDKPVTLKLDINENLPCKLYGDDLRIKQILNNLLSNAFKYTRRGIVTLGIDCRRDGDSVWVDFYISDTGIGIKKEDIAKLFTDYNQVDTRANRKIEGTGLGLSITKKFVELMDGEISVESGYGKGTTFRVRIRQGFVTDKPIGKETVENLQGFRYLDNKKLANRKLVRSDLSYARVLVVDDYPSNLDVAAGMLRKYKLQVDCVDNGQDAVLRIAEGEPVYDAVFMDHMMPEMDGIEATAKIRALSTKYAGNIPIIALTANAVAGNEQMFLENGFNAFLPKPFNVMNLDSIIQRWVRDKSRE